MMNPGIILISSHLLAFEIWIRYPLPPEALTLVLDSRRRVRAWANGVLRTVHLRPPGGALRDLVAWARNEPVTAHASLILHRAVETGAGAINPNAREEFVVSNWLRTIREAETVIGSGRARRLLAVSARLANRVSLGTGSRRGPDRSGGRGSRSRDQGCPLR